MSKISLYPVSGLFLWKVGRYIETRCFQRKDEISKNFSLPLSPYAASLYSSPLWFQSLFLDFGPFSTSFLWKVAGYIETRCFQRKNEISKNFSLPLSPYPASLTLARSGSRHSFFDFRQFSRSFLWKVGRYIETRCFQRKDEISKNFCVPLFPYLARCIETRVFQRKDEI